MFKHYKHYSGHFPLAHINNKNVFSGLFGSFRVSFRVFSGLFVSSRVFSGLLGINRCVFSGLLSINKCVFSGFFGSFQVFSGLFGSSRVFSGLLGKNKCPERRIFFYQRPTLNERCELFCTCPRRRLMSSTEY